MATRKNVTWKTGEKPTPRLRRRAFIADRALPRGSAELYERNLFLGGIFTTLCGLCVWADNRFIAPPLPYLEAAAPWEDHPIKKGSFAVYAGTERVEEDNRGTIVRIHRHSFIVGGGKYIVTDLNWFSPVI